MAAALQNQRNLIFASVFPFAAASHGNHHHNLSSGPHPLSAVTTPDASFAAPAHHHHSTRSHDRPSHHHHNANPKHVQRNVAWNTATRFLKLPDWHPGGANTRARKHHHRLNADVEEALRYLLVGEGRPDSEDGGGGGGGMQADLLEWYTNEARENFVACVRPAVLGRWQAPVATEQAWAVLEETAATLRQAQAFYFQHLDEHLLPVVREAAGGGEHAAERVAAKFRRDLHAIVMHALPQQRFAKTLAFVLYDAGCRLFGLSAEDRWVRRGSDAEDGRQVQQRVSELLRELRAVGLGGDQAQRAAAQAMDSLMESFISSHHMKVDWYGRKPVTRVLREWVKDGYSPYIKEILTCLTGDEEVFEANEVQQWTTMAVGRLGRARVENLFDYIVNWDRSLGAILDLKVGFSHIEDEEGNRVDLGQDISAEIAAEMLNPVASNVQEEDQELNWADMNWMPDPVDASPEYKSAKSENVLAYLLSLYDREDFINELKNILGEHLLKNEDSEFEKEIRLLELFKLRLGDSNLQACEVMLKDVLESKRMNKQIHHILQQQSKIYRDIPTELSSQILSSFFWPSLREDEFHLPAPIQALMKEYEAGFEGIKDMRKLHWLPALGRVTVSLEFDDRRLDLDVLPWQAAVIYAFQEDDTTLDDDEEGLPAEDEHEERERQRRARLRAVGASAPTPEKPKLKKPPVTRTIEQLEEQLEMDDGLLRSALTFWVGHRVLTEPAPDTFAVLDSLSDLAADADAEEAAALAAEEAAEAEKASAVKSAEDVLVENMQMYRQFVMGMLTNQGRMGADRVCAMLKVALMGGFPFGVEEVGVLLGRMVEEGVLVAVGDGFAVKK
ncbi:Cullin binding protein [Neofusicoccum parvum]|uniref:Cullin binding protein n=1 Tax=Neofusicoccum parvum TaxID=310453 RepID=A0ACB5RNM7_9PEZI|nr:Cullin binding protein [Neofusicoccum parvum]